MQYSLGVDIGTFDTKAVLVDLDGQIIAQANKGHKMLVPFPGWAEHRPNQDWWGDFCETTHSVIAQGQIDVTDIKVVACSAIGPCMLPVDKNGEALMNGVLYGVDTRAHQEINDLNKEIGADQILAMGGNALTSQSVGPKILWLKRNRPEIFEKTHKILTSTSFLVHKLTGEYVIDHYTAANFSPLYDIHNQCWSQTLTADLISEEALPDLRWSTDVVGVLSEKAAKETGLPTGIPVTTGTIDAAAEAVSVGVSETGDTMCMYGSTIFMISLTSQRVEDHRLWYAPWLFKNQHACMAGLATSGTLTHWFREHFGKDLDEDTSFFQLSLEAEKSKAGANGLVFLPYFSGERTPIHDPDAKGVVFGLRLDHTRGDVYRSLIEGIAFGTRHVVDTFAESGTKTNRIFAVGGGTKNDLWLQTTSDITGIDQILREKTVGASYGDAFLGALAIGAVSPSDMVKWNPKERLIEAKRDALLEKNYEVFKSLYTSTKDLMKVL